MFKIISSTLTDCEGCPLESCPSCILETNCKYLDDVEVIFIAENPGKDEVDKEVPLIGKSGQVFRKSGFNFYFFKNKVKYLLTNVVLCQTINPDGTTGNPSKEVIERCKLNCFDIIRKCNPKLIVLMGASACSAFGISGGITKIRGNYFEWENYKILVTIHPSYLARRPNPEMKENFTKDLFEAYKYVTGNAEKKMEITSGIKESKEKAPVFITIPDKFYTNEYRLVDIQSIKNNSKIIFIFRDKDNKKVYHEENAQYYCYESSNRSSKLVENYDNLKTMRLEYKNKYSLNANNHYEGDIRIDNKYAVDYYLLNKEEAPTKNLNIFFVDIEVDLGETMEFPRPEEAKRPINSISYRYHGKTISYSIASSLVKNKPTISEDRIFVKTEKELVSKLVNDLVNIDPDIIAGWNLGFDLLYIYNRCPKLGISNKILSKYGELEFDTSRNYLHIAGKICIDMCNLYKTFSQSRKESYTLDFIAQEELEHTKVRYDGTITDLYRNDIDKFVEYNRTDVELLDELERKRHYISLLNELRLLCSTTFRSSFSTIGQIDNYVLCYLKKKGMSPRNFVSSGDNSSIPGGYVKEPNLGIHDWIVDFDFKSLYPSLIITYNIGFNTFVMKFKDFTNGYDFIYNIDSFPDKVEVILDPLEKNELVIMKKEDLIAKFKNEKLVVTINGCFYKSHEEESSFFSDILKELMETRDIYKKKMFKAENKTIETEYDMKQWAYKILANSFYGVLANSHFRFFCPDLASSVTLSGQEITKTCILEAENYMSNFSKN